MWSLQVQISPGSPEIVYDSVGRCAVGIAENTFIGQQGEQYMSMGHQTCYTGLTCALCGQDGKACRILYTGRPLGKLTAKEEESCLRRSIACIHTGSEPAL